MGQLSKRTLLIIILGVFAAGLVPVFRLWKAAGDRGGQQAAEPFRIAGNFYYVGTTSVSVFLITGPEGHVLLDAGYPGSTQLITASIEKLGFDIKDVKVLLNSNPYREHAGGLATLQQASGAKLWASEASAYTLASGGDDPHLFLPARVLIQTGIVGGYPPPRVDHQFKDGETVRLGSIALTAHITGGSTRGCTSWSFQVSDRNHLLNIVNVCRVGMMAPVSHPEQAADLERSFRVLRSLPADIWVTPWSREWSRYPKFTASTTAKDPVEAFIDLEGYRNFLDKSEAEMRRGAVH